MWWVPISLWLTVESVHLKDSKRKVRIRPHRWWRIMVKWS